MRVGTMCAVAMAGAALTVAGCAGVQGNPQANPDRPATAVTGTAAPTTAAPATGTPADQPDVTALCSAVQDQFPDFRLHGANLGRLGLNAAVLEWAVRNNIPLTDTFDTPLVDEAMAAQCPQTHADTLEYLDIATISDGLVGPH